MTHLRSVPLPLESGSRSRPRPALPARRRAARPAAPSRRAAPGLTWGVVMLARLSVNALTPPAARAHFEAGAALSWSPRTAPALTRALYDLWALVGYREPGGARLIGVAVATARAQRHHRLARALQALADARVGLFRVGLRRHHRAVLRPLDAARELDVVVASGGGAEDPRPGDLALGWIVPLGAGDATLAAWHIVGRDAASPVLEALRAGRDAARAFYPGLSADACSAVALPLAAAEIADDDALAWLDVDELADAEGLDPDLVLDALAAAWDQRARACAEPLPTPRRGTSP
ncbi:MAG: hypothetical protein H6745_11400 [Deltaproteobacteria bacterium]|nr:hypothetical protein [Deltaproteobacteria bacterium]